MDLPVLPPVSPMLAKAATKLPTGEGFFYEPKWDGFRCIVFRDGDEVELGSRNERPLTRYFPEVVAAVDESLLDVPFAERQARLRGGVVKEGHDRVHVTALTQDVAVAERWFEQFEGAGLDGVVAKAGDVPYCPDQRLMVKVKHVRTADCVVAGFRWHKSGPIVGSLLLGLYNDAGDLQHIGVAASFPMTRRAELVEELAPYRAQALDGHPWQDWANAELQEDGEHRMPGAVSRWNAKKDLSWVPLRPELVVEIKYDQLEGRRLRHTGQFLRWRPDRDALSCTYDQLEVPVRYDLGEVLAGGRSADRQ